MQEFEPKKKVRIFTKEFIAKYAYIFIIALVLVGGFSYGLTFYVQNKKIASGSITTANLTINFTDRTINASNLSVPTDNQEGLTEYSKSVTVTNQTAIDGRVKLTLTRTSGLNLTDMSYALVVNGAVQEIGDVPASGEILETALMGNESIEVELRLWPKTTYTGSATTFVGELTPEIKYLGPVASSRTDLVGKYVDFNCNGSTCEEWQVVKIEDGRLVLTKPADYEGATSRTNSNRYNPDSFNPALTFNDDSMITSLSTDGKNVYLAKTVKITGGSGTQADPYIFENIIFNEEDKKVIAVITYKDDTTTVGTQNIYYNETNYISRVLNDPAFSGWLDGTTLYKLGDTVTFTTDKNLLANKTVNAENLSFINTTTGYTCTDAQCAIENLANDAGIEPPLTGAQYILANATLETTPYGKVYSGANVDNYVKFNCDGTTCEEWRILGVYGDKLKIVRATPIASQTYNAAKSDGNVWGVSRLEQYLNQNTDGGYYYSLSADAKNMIAAGSWDVGACGTGIAETAYTCATTTSTYSSVTYTTPLTNKKVGLIASYEYLYAAENDGTCWTTSGGSYNNSCGAKDWLFSTLTSTSSGIYYAWTLSPYSGSTDRALSVVSGGLVNAFSVDHSHGASPVVYLKSGVTITGGNGQSGNNAYALSYSGS